MPGHGFGGDGLGLFDGTDWQIYSSSNSELPDDWINTTTIDVNNSLWVGTGDGLVRITEDNHWQVFNHSNSGLPDNNIKSIAIDDNGDVWVGTDGGIAVYKNGITVSVADQKAIEIPGSVVLHQNYPNPFNPSTNIEFTLPQSSHVKLEVFNSTGQLVSTLLDQTKTGGKHSVQFDASNLSSGLYIYRLTTSGKQLTRKFIFIK